MLGKDTICAISTAPGNGAIAIIRLSGDKAFDITKKIIAFKNNNVGLKHNTIAFADVYNDNNIIDEVLVSSFHAPNSYTGQNIVEISCHGSNYIQQQILQLLINSGARLAKPGEFTLRAFLNKKLDLSQAEGVADLIATSSKASHNIAIKQMRGGFSDEISILRGKLLKFTSLIELELDFGEEDVEFADRKQLMKLIVEIQQKILSLMSSFKLGNVIKNGVPVAIVGNPNVGKSTLLNVFLNEEKAIVSEIPGTTRDSIEDTININGVNFRFIDTAGIRNSKNKIEKIGIDRTFKNIGKANIVLIIVEPNHNIKQLLDKVKKAADKEAHIFVVVNKTDIYDSDVIKNSFADIKEDITYISAKNKSNIDKLTSKITDVINLKQIDGNEFIVSNARHYEALQSANKAIERTIEGINNNISGDFLSMDIREAIHYLGEITGEITNDEVLGSIFEKFCIGK